MGRLGDCLNCDLWELYRTGFTIVRDWLWELYQDFLSPSLFVQLILRYSLS